MRNRAVIAILAAMCLTTSVMFTGCGDSSSDTSNNQQTVQEQAGNQSETKSGDQSGTQSGDQSETQSGNQSVPQFENNGATISMVKSVDADNNIITVSSMSNFGGSFFNGNFNGGSTDGSDNSGQTPPSGDGSNFTGQTPPNGGNFSGQTPPNDGNFSGQTPPSGDGSSFSSETLPEGETRPEFNGESFGGSGEDVTYTVTDGASITDADGNVISLSDLSEGTMVELTLDDDGNVTAIAISNASSFFNGEQSAS